jgi:hypothetical protein
MSLAAFIDVILTPIGGGVGGYIGARMVARGQDWPARLPIWVGVITAVALFVLKLTTQ